jgi:hypothetical protein
MASSGSSSIPQNLGHFSMTRPGGSPSVKYAISLSDCKVRGLARHVTCVVLANGTAPCRGVNERRILDGQRSGARQLIRYHIMAGRPGPSTPHLPICRKDVDTRRCHGAGSDSIITSPLRWSSPWPQVVARHRLAWSASLSMATARLYHGYIWNDSFDFQSYAKATSGIAIAVSLLVIIAGAAPSQGDRKASTMERSIRYG